MYLDSCLRLLGCAALAQAPSQPETGNSQLDAELFYELLVGEIERTVR